MEIATRWNKKGCVVKFEINDAYISKFDVQTVGARYHQEYWIPAEELEEFNKNIIGTIEIIQTI
jgi:hypothetical protein